MDERPRPLHLIASSLVLAAGIWLSSGTLAPYAATGDVVQVLEPCHYLGNLDHRYFVATFRMLEGRNVSEWGGTILPRMLFPLLAFPFMKLWGFLIGGFVCSLVLNVAALVLFALFIGRRFGRSASEWILWLLATYPGIAYWAGLPYCYVTIVPISLLITILLFRLQRTATLAGVVGISLLTGILFTGYDVAPFFIPPAIVILLLRRRFLWTFTAVALMIVPTLLSTAILESLEVPLLLSNREVPAIIAGAWLHPSSFAAWGSSLLQLPSVLLSNFIFSNFIFLPLLAIAAAALLIRRASCKDLVVENSIAGATLLLFLFNNAAPPYEGWQMRGDWMARLYQPVFVAYVLYVARAIHVRWLKAATAVVVLINASIVFGAILLNPLSQYAYHRFYRHSAPDAMFMNLETWGRRPLGFCSERHVPGEGQQPARRRIPEYQFHSRV